MTKYRQADKLTQEQRKDIAVLVNCGVNRAGLAKDYGVSTHTIASIARQRARYIGEENIARTPSDQFQYAQGEYVQLEETERRYIERQVFGKIIEESMPPAERAEDKLLGFIFGYERLPGDCRKMERSSEEIETWRASTEKSYSARESYAIRALQQNLSEGRRYLTIEEAVAETKVRVSSLEESELSGGERERREDIKRKLESALEQLTFREREIIKRRCGLGQGYTYSLEEVSEIFKVTRERVRQVEAKAIRKLQHPLRTRKLEGFL